MNEVRLYLAQRLTAALMVPLIAVHLIIIVYAMGEGLSAGEILARTRGSALWAGFYATFVLAAAVHGAIGLRAVLIEWTGLNRRGAGIAGLVAAIVLASLGLRAVYAVVAA